MPSFHMSLKRLAQSCSFPHGIAITYLERTLTVPSMTDSMNWYSCQENELGFLHTVFSFQFQVSSFCIGSQLEFALQAAPWCHGAGDRKYADVPLGGERPRLLFDLIYNV